MAIKWFGIGVAVTLLTALPTHGGEAPKTVAPVPVMIGPVEFDKAMDEFEAVCLGPGFDLARTQGAIAASPYRYKARSPHTGEFVLAQQWASWGSIVTLDRPVKPQHDGMMVPRCTITMHLNAARMPRDILAHIRSRVMRHFPDAVLGSGENALSLTWNGEGSTSYQVDLLVSRDDRPTETFWLSYFRLSEAGQRAQVRERCRLAGRESC
ncbi:MAG: hypothetical protein ABL926_14120 [Novosphingobium sp.]|uniref:hypothetical protein n=1 Tax=Novosphingobium sp. TaxID=1874826 RepID=UPI0032B817B1